MPIPTFHHSRRRRSRRHHHNHNRRRRRTLQRRPPPRQHQYNCLLKSNSINSEKEPNESHSNGKKEKVLKKINL